MAAPKKTVPMCVVRLGHRHLLMPSADGMKFVEILQRTVEVDPNYESRGYTYTMMDQPEAEFVTVKTSQVRAQRGADGVISIEDMRNS